MNDILITNPVFGVILAAAAGGVVATMAITEFIKTIYDDYKERHPNSEGWLDTRNALRFIAVLATLLYTLTVYGFNGLNDVRLDGTSAFLRYFMFWVALSITTMGGYDLLRQARGKPAESGPTTPSAPGRSFFVNPDGTLRPAKMGETTPPNENG